MKKVDKHGMRMQGLRAACGATKDFGPYSGRSTEITYNLRTGEVSWSRYYDDNHWSLYNDPDELVICRVRHHLTMQEIADAILEMVELLECQKTIGADG